MTGGPIDENARELLRGYCLDTIDPDDRSVVEARLAGSTEWKEALSLEQQRLAQLDVLTNTPPAHDLTRVVMDAIDNQKVLVFPRKPLWKRWWPYAGAAVAACVVLIALVPAIARSRESARRAADQGNMKQLAMMLQMYANEAPRGLYPPLTPYSGLWMFKLEAVYPKYLTDLAMLVSPSLPDADAVLSEMQSVASTDPIDWKRLTELAARSYAYSGWALDPVKGPHDLHTQIAGLAPEQYDQDLVVDGAVYPRLRQSIERFFITDTTVPGATPRAEIPVVFNAPTVIDARTVKKNNVLFMDGHVMAMDVAEAAPGAP
ncbi:MAG: hypothetical protein AMXMBFR84_38430 [Candidatus Hydrogenedentota bacterium]